ncbi:MAG TPA: hypothetical protein DHN33_05330, partial [Eubacteriaceae bacterium]|nr:hypothetical protein [Eubacteriaceae bacterium]
KEKYSFESNDVIDLIHDYSFHKGEDLTVLQKAVEQKQYPLALREIYNFMNRLKEIILSPEKTEAVENIYYKRHIAAGIPSMYGEYREPKFDALGLMYKLERVAAKMMNQILQYFNSEYITAKTFRQIYDILELFKDGLELDGIYNQGFNSHIDMLRFSLASPSFSIDQYVNIFEFMANDIKQIIREYFFDIFESPMKVIIPQLHADNLPESEGELRKLYHIESERFLRDNLSTAFLVQDLDNFITDIIDVLRNLTNAYPKDIIKSMMTYDPDLTFSPLSQHTEDIDNPVFLGAKAYFLKKLKEYQFPVPSGFVITTEVFRHIETINTIPEMMRDFDLLIENHIAKVEDLTGKYFGKADNPLFFSIRSGSSIS